MSFHVLRSQPPGQSSFRGRFTVACGQNSFCAGSELSCLCLTKESRLRNIIVGSWFSLVSLDTNPPVLYIISSFPISLSLSLLSPLSLLPCFFFSFLFLFFSSLASQALLHTVTYHLCGWPHLTRTHLYLSPKPTITIIITISQMLPQNQPLPPSSPPLPPPHPPPPSSPSQLPH